MPKLLVIIAQFVSQYHEVYNSASTERRLTLLCLAIIAFCLLLFLLITVVFFIVAGIKKLFSSFRYLVYQIVSFFYYVFIFPVMYILRKIQCAIVYILTKLK